MTFIKTYRFKLLPTKKQEDMFCRNIGTTRFVYNKLNEKSIKQYEELKTRPSKFELVKSLVAMKGEFEWMKEVHSQTLQAVAERLDNSFQVFFREIKAGKKTSHPKFAKRGLWKSFLFKQGVKVLVEEDKIFLPKIGHVKYVKSQEVGGKIKTASIVREADGWFVCLACELEAASQHPMQAPSNDIIAFDMGLKTFLVDNNGNEIVKPNNFTRNQEKRMKSLQQKLARKNKGSKNEGKCKKEIALLHTQTKNQRKDFLHKLSTNIVRENQTIILEELGLKNMTRRNKSKQDEDGKFMRNGQAAKSGRNKNFADAGFGMFVSMLKYKANWHGRNLVLVDPRFTSKTCNVCGCINAELKLSDRAWTCDDCGALHDRDMNAAKNILQRGLEKLNRCVSGQEASVKKELEKQLEEKSFDGDIQTKTFEAEDQFTCSKRSFDRA